MTRKRWPTFGYDSARVNAHISKTTGKWGKLKDPDEIWDYMEKHLDGQGSLLNPPIPKPEEKPAEPPKPRCGISTGRVILIGQGKAQLCTADDHGNPIDVIETKPATGGGKAWKCVNCNTGFQEWAAFIDHCLAQPKP